MRLHSARSASLISIAAVSLLVGNASVSHAESTDVPRIVDTTAYEKEGGTDPKSMLPEGEAIPAESRDVADFADLLTRTTGLQLLQAPAQERYEEIGSTLRISLGDENDEDFAHSLTVTRVTVKGDVPESVLSSEGDETRRTTLPDGTQLMTAKGGAGVTVSLLSPGGQLTVWDAPGPTEASPLTVQRLTEWATTVETQHPGAVDMAASPGLRAAKPSCQLKLTKPFKHGSLTIQADAFMSCDQKGRGNFTASLRQYHGLGLWKSKSIRGYTNKHDKIFPVTLNFKCSRATVSKWVYRADIGNATLRNGNGYWGRHNIHSKTSGIHCA
ncbi:hypothetical protein [Streptomyces sp. NPDC059063]|uniref:hypothetical protein n=1 Tax=unclassified Streptomyces TaxID=2593676 RepID=UPI0036C5F704